MQFFITILIFTINILLWFWFFIAFKKKYSPEKVLEQIRIEVEKLIISINNETDRDVTLIESRIKGLKKLIQEADKRMHVSNNELKKRQTEQNILEALNNTPVPQKKTAVQQKLSFYETDYAEKQIYEKDISESIDIAVQESTVDTKKPQDQLVITKNPLPQNNSKLEEILRLADLGLEEQSIATKLGIPIGEVNFIINLSKI
ncbi:MAG: hypothetical protein ACRC5H_05010 [Treponemataceae bacterium]